MKKIIAAIDGLKYSESTVNYAIHLAKQANTHLVGIFLEDFTYHSYKIQELVTAEGEFEDQKVRLDKKDESLRRQSLTRFEEACEKEGLNYSVRRDKNIAIQDLLHESIYADLLIINCTETLSHYEENIPTRFIRDLLSNVQCPVLVVPENYRPIENKEQKRNSLVVLGAYQRGMVSRWFRYAEWLGEALGLSITTPEELKGDTLARYDYVIIGSSVYIGKLQIKNWLKMNAGILKDKRLFMFIVCGTSPGERAKLDLIAKNNVPAALIDKCIVHFLHGRMNMKELSVMDRFLVKMGARTQKDPVTKKNMLQDFNDVKKENIISLQNDVNTYIMGEKRPDTYIEAPVASIT